MNARERILAKARAATDVLPDKTPLPEESIVSSVRSRFAPDSKSREAVVAGFEEVWNAVGGALVRSETELLEKLKDLGASKGYVDPSLSAERLKEAFVVDGRFNRSEVDAYDFGVTRASVAIAETGTVVLTDGDTPNRLSALAPWIHVAVLSRETIQATLREALPGFGSDPSVVMVSGPSKTADIEGILIEGVHGPGVQICWLV